MKKLLGPLAIAIGAAAFAPRAFAADAAQPQKLSDAQLDDVTGGMGPPAFVMAAGHGPPFVSPTGGAQTQVNVTFRNVNLTFNVSDGSSLNYASTFQLSLLSQQPQAASATAVQTSSPPGH